MNMKKLIALGGTAMFLECACALDALVISNVSAKQHEPWNGMVDVSFIWECEDTNEVATVRLDATDVDGGTNLMVATVYNGESIMHVNEIMIRPGENCLQWDAKTDCPNHIYSNVRIGLRVSHGGPYLSVDLLNKNASWLQTVPEGSWQNEYKASKMLFRKVYAGTDPLNRYSISHDY